MAKSLEQILGYVPLSGLIKATTTGIPDPLGMFDKFTKPTIGDIGRYTQVNGTRTLARRVEYGAPSLRRELKNVAVKDVKLIHTFEHIEINQLTMQLLRNINNYDLQQQGIDEVQRQVAEMKVRFQNLRTAAKLSALSFSKIWFDSSGNMLPTSSGAAVTVDFGTTTASNQGVAQDEAGAAIISASWNTSSTDIPGQLRTFKATALRRTGYPLKYAIYGASIPSFLAKNDFVKDWYTRHPQKREEYLDTGDLPNGLLGLTWIPGYDAFFEDSTGVNKDFWATDRLTLCPEPSADWFEIMEGSYQVPTSFNVMPDALAAHGNFKAVNGMGGFGLPMLNPPGAFQGHFFDTFLPIIKVPNAIFNDLDTTT